VHAIARRKVQEVNMRDDMSKVLVEAPRSGRHYVRALDGTRRARRNRLDHDGESAPPRMGICRDAIERKRFGEHLNPLYRYLSKQIHRPWAKVYSELTANADRRNTVQEHVFQHIRSHVAIETFWRDGQVFAHSYLGPEPQAESGTELYVHPLTGIVLPNRAGAKARQHRKAQRAARNDMAHPDRRIGLPGMPVDRQWHRVKGIWYEVALCLLEVDTAAAPVYDAVLGQFVNRDSRKELVATYGYGDVYAWSKRQLPTRTLRRHGLTSQAE